MTISMTPQEIVEKIIGPINPIGETNEDNTRLENLEEMTKLVDALLMSIDTVFVNNKDRMEYSRKRAADFSSKFFDDVGIT